MATLAAGIETDVLVVIPNDTTLKWLTNQNNPGGSAYVAALVTKACSHAAATLQEYLGASVDSTDVAAVALGVEMAMHKLRYGYRGLNPPEGTVTWGQLIAQAEAIRDRRRTEETTGASWYAPEGVAGDKRYPAAARDRGATKNTTYTG